MNHSNDCKSKWKLKSILTAFAFTFLSIFTISCDDETTSKEGMAPSDLRYASVSEVYEGRAMKSAQPVVYANTKPLFELVGGRAEDNGVYLENEFQINAENGAISLLDDNNLVVGLYQLDVKVSNEEGEVVFPAAFELRILPSSLEGLKYTPYTQTIVRKDKGSKTSLPVFKGTKPATFSLTEENDFVIDAITGAVSLKEDSKISAGKYKLSVLMANEAGEQVFENVLEINVETKIEVLNFEPSEYLDVQQKQSKETVVPTIKGTVPCNFALKDNFGSFLIDANSGVVSLSSDHSLAIGDYSLTVVASNVHGSVEFQNALTFQIVKIKETVISDLLYPESSYTIKKGVELTTESPSYTGSTPKFELENDYAAFTIDQNSGIINLLEGNSLSEGVYNLTVVATNDVGVSTFNDIVTVTIEAASFGIIFEDGWQGLLSSDHQIGNFIIVDRANAGAEDSKGKWANSWKINQMYGYGEVGKVSTADMKCSSKSADLSENDDWMISTEINLTNVTDPEILIHLYQVYVWDYALETPSRKREDRLYIKVSEDYTGDVTAANWIVLHEFDPSKIYRETIKGVYDNRIPHVFDSKNLPDLSLKTYEGKKITIAIQNVTDEGSTGDTAIQKFQVLGTR